MELRYDPVFLKPFFITFLCRHVKGGRSAYNASKHILLFIDFPLFLCTLYHIFGSVEVHCPLEAKAGGYAEQGGRVDAEKRCLLKTLGNAGSHQAPTQVH